MSPKEVARIAFRDFNKGKTIIIPGFKNKLMVYLNKFMPRGLIKKNNSIYEQKRKLIQFSFFGFQFRTKLPKEFL